MGIKIGGLKSGKRPLVAAALTDKDIKSIKAGDVGAIDIIELRVDMFSKLSCNFVSGTFKKMQKKLSKPILGTIRMKSEGGKVFIKDTQRYDLFKAIIPLADMIDIEIQSTLFEPVVKLAHNFGKSVIASYHNFKITPREAFLSAMLSKSKRAGADLTKLALKANSMNDVARLLRFTMDHKEMNLITISLGKTGMVSRVINPFFGSLITYGYIGSPKADGQMHVQQLAKQLRTYDSW